MTSALDAEELRSRLVAPNGPYAALDVVAKTASTNADLVSSGGADRTVLIALEQTAGQGRRGRTWASPEGGLYCSVLFRPAGVPAAQLPWLNLIAGLALVRVARSVGVEASLKWPNDLLLGAGAGKGAGILSEITADGSVVVGIGLNVAKLPSDVEPAPGGLAPTSLEDLGAAELDRGELAFRLLVELAQLEGVWRKNGGDAVESGVLEEYVEHSSTIGQRVRVELSGGLEILGVAQRVEPDGTLVVRGDDGQNHGVSAGDVVHLRPA